MANTVNQWGNPKAKEIYDKYMSGDNKDKVYIPESDYYSPENVERRRQVQDKINSMPKFWYPETPEFIEKHPYKTMDEYLGSLNPNDKVAAIPSNQSNIDWESLREPWTATNWWETAGSTVPQNAQTNVANDGTIKVWPQNANLNYYQYWDDSNPAQQWQKGWMKEKYTWEWVSNSYIEYNPDLTVADLDPNYLYWENARQQNRREAWYIARRNDNIASALYNEWLTSREDVANFLSQQNEWMNSTEADRMNTIESVWKRLWQTKPEETPTPEEEPQADFNKDTSGKIYGKTTAEEWNPKQWIDTLSDANSVFKAMQESRVKSLQDFVSQDVSNIATCVVEWATYWSEQTWRDAQKYYPEFIAAVNEEVKKQRWQQNVTAIASGGEMVTDTNWQSNINNEIANFWASNASWTKSSIEITKDVHNAMAQSQTASEASETMAGIEEDMAILKNRMKNLRQEANVAFKWDVPDYLVNAYINNKAQEIQNQMSILEDRYNAAYDRYKTELSNKQWEMEYKLKQDQLQLQKDELALKEYQIKNWTTSTKNTWTSTTNPWDKFQVTTLSDKEVADAVDNLYSMFDNWQLGNAQCGVWIQRYYLPMLWISISGISSLEWKKSLINEDEWYTPKKWDLIIINSGAKLEDWTPAWHIGIVLEVHNDWTVEYMDWNGKSDEKAAVNGININSKSILWYRNINKWQWQNSWWWTDYDYTRFEQYRDATSKSEKETIAAEYWTNVQWMNNIVRDALTNRGETSNVPDYSNKEWTNIDYANFNNFLNSDNKDISNTDRESIAEMYWFKWNLPWMREFAKTQLANRPETEETDGSIRFKKYENWFNPSLVQSFENFWTTKMSDPQFKSMLKTERLTEEEFWQQRDNYFNYKQTEFDEAWLEILNKIADFQIAMDDMWKIDDWIFDKNWLWNTRFWWWPAKAAFDAMTSEQLLNKYVQARSSWVTFWSTTEAEWDIMKATNALEKTTWLQSSDKDFTRAYKSYLRWVWEQTMKKPFTNEEWDSFWTTRKTNRDNVNISSTNGGVKNNPPKPTTTPNAPIIPNVPSWTQWTWWKQSLGDL